MKKVLLITPGMLPVPATKGGAVEALIQTYLDYNEKNPEFIFDVFTIDNTIERKYKYANFYIINKNGMFFRISQVLRYIINNKMPFFYIGNAFIDRVCKYIKKNNKNYDLVIIENNAGYILKLKKIVKNCKYILHLHNDYLNNHIKKSTEILKSYDRIISISDYLSTRIKTIDKYDKISVIHNGVNVNNFKMAPSTEKIDFYKNKFKISDKDIVVMYSGRLIKEKGIDVLVDAINDLIDNGYNNLKLLVAGAKFSSDSKKDRFIKSLEKKCEKNINNFIFTGFIKYNEMPIIHYISDIQIIPSKWGEPLGNVVIEGAASGIRQIVTNDGGICEVIGENTIVIDKDDLKNNLISAITNCINDNNLKYRKKSSRIISSCSEEAYSEKIFEVLRGEINDT